MGASVPSDDKPDFGSANPGCRRIRIIPIITKRTCSGLGPHFGCCTANFNQAWPKFAISAVMKNERGPVVQSLVPCCAQVETPNGTVQVHIVSMYPFRDNAVIELSSEKPAEICLQIRIPALQRKQQSTEKSLPRHLFRAEHSG